MPKELVVVPGAVAKRAIAVGDGDELTIYEPIHHLAAVAMDFRPGEWVKVRMHSTGVHICEREDEPETDADWESVVFG